MSMQRHSEMHCLSWLFRMQPLYAVTCIVRSHRACLYKYINELSGACLTAAKHTLPYTSLRSTKGRIPGWSEHVEPARQKSLFWHEIWVNCGRPRSGTVANIMRKTRASCQNEIMMISLTFEIGACWSN